MRACGGFPLHSSTPAMHRLPAICRAPRPLCAMPDPPKAAARAAFFALLDTHSGRTCCRWRRRVLGLLSIALSSARTVVLPPAWCFCDVYWGGMT